MASRRLTQWVRRDLLWAAAGFCALQIVLAVAIEFSLKKVRDPEFTEKVTELRLRRRESPGLPLLMVLGSSRTKYGLEAGLLGGANGKPRALVFNFGIGGGGPMLQLVCLRRLLAEKIHPDFLFVEINAGSLLQDDGRPMERRWLDGARLRGRELVWLRPYHSHFARLLWRWGWARLLPCRSEQAALHQILDTYPTLFAGRNGWQVQFAQVTPEQRKLYSELAQRQYQEVFRQFHFAAPSLRALTDLLGLCRKEAIPFALLVMPEGSAFRAYYAAAGQAEFQAFLNRLHETWQAPIIDARAWVPDDGFWDTHHMLPAGALVFTLRFGQEVIDPLLARRLH